MTAQSRILYELSYALYHLSYMSSRFVYKLDTLRRAYLKLELEP